MTPIVLRKCCVPLVALVLLVSCMPKITEPLNYGSDAATVLTTGSMPSISFGGNRMLFTRTGSIILSDTSGMNQKIMTTGHHDLMPRWAPGDKNFGFIRDDATTQQIIMTDTSLSQQSVICSARLLMDWDTHPTLTLPVWDWSSSGKFVALLVHEDGVGISVVVIDLSSLTSVKKWIAITDSVFTSGDFAAGFSWEPNGDRIAMLSERTKGQRKIVIQSAASDSIATTFNLSSDAFLVRWSHNGNQILTSKNGLILLISLGDGATRVLPYSPYGAKFSSDDLWIASETLWSGSIGPSYRVYSEIGIVSISTGIGQLLTGYGDSTHNLFFEWALKSDCIFFDRGGSIWRANTQLNY